MHHQLSYIFMDVAVPVLKLCPGLVPIFLGHRVYKFHYYPNYAIEQIFGA